jgi:hypothetical protein
LSPGAPKEPLAQRLYRELARHLADRGGCCPVHGTQLLCPLCDLVWTGAAAEEREIEGLAVWATVTGDQETSPWRCHRCRAEAMCPDCYEPVADQAWAGLTPEEQARVHDLSLRYRVSRPLDDPAEDGNPLHEGESHARPLRRA